MKAVRTTAAMGALILGFATAGGTPAAAQDSYMGQALLVGFNFCPRDTISAEGQLLPIDQFQALYSLFGTTYGGDGRNSFALPDLRDKAPVDGMRYCIVAYGIYPPRP